MSKFLDCYFRVSTQEQTKGQSLDTQQDYGQKIAKKLGLNFRPRNEGAKSSTRGFRPQLEEIKEDIENGDVKHLWVFDRSRLFRDETDSVLFRRNYLEKFNVSFYEGETGNLCNFDSLEEKLTYDIVSKLQQYENEKRSYKSKQGKRHLLKQGVKNRHFGGTVQFGYKSDNGTLSIHPEESKWVLFMFNSIVEGKSTMEIKKILDTDGKAAGIEPRRTKSNTWNIGTIESILKNKSYVGEKEFYDKELNKNFLYSISPIITYSLFSKVRKEIHKRQKYKDNHKKHFALYDGLLFCECGQRIGSRSNTSGKGYITKCYYCVSKNAVWKTGQKSNCSNSKSMSMEITDDYLNKKITNVVRNSVSLKERFKTEVLTKKIEKDQDIKDREKKLEVKCKRLVTRQEQTYANIVSMETDLIQGRREEKVTKGILKNLNEELETLKSELKKTELEIDDLSEEKVWLNWLEKYGDYLNTKIEDKTDEQKRWLKGVIENIVVYPDFGNDRSGELTQIGHKFEVVFKMNVVKDKLIYNDSNNKSLGYTIQKGRKKLTTETVELKNYRGKKKLLNKNVGVGVTLGRQSNLCYDSGVILIDDQISNEYKQYLCFSAYFSTNTLVFGGNEHLWSDEQQKTHDNIKSLHNSGMGYRKIASHLNEQGIKTVKGNLWGGNNVHSVLKRNRERLHRLEVQKQDSEVEYGKMELVWLRDDELWKNPRVE